MKARPKLNWKYAIGEVILIFIGITMAFGLQQWANSRSEYLKSLKYLGALELEVESNIRNITSHAEYTQKDADRIKNYIERINSDSSDFFGDSEITEMMENLGPPYFNSLSVAAYQDIINSGGMEFISDPNIRLSLLKYGTFLIEYESRVENSLNSWYTTLSPYMQANADLSKMNIQGMTFDYPKEIFKNDRDAFIKNRDFTNLLRSRIIWQLGVVRFINIELEGIEKFKGQIETYLNQ